MIRKFTLYLHLIDVDCSSGVWILDIDVFIAMSFIQFCIHWHFQFEDWYLDLFKVLSLLRTLWNIIYDIDQTDISMQKGLTYQLWFANCKFRKNWYRYSLCYFLSIVQLAFNLELTVKTCTSNQNLRISV